MLQGLSGPDSCPNHHDTPQQWQSDIKTGGDHVQQHALEVVFAGIGEHLQEVADVGVHGEDQVLIHPCRGPDGRLHVEWVAGFSGLRKPAKQKNRNTCGIAHFMV